MRIDGLSNNQTALRADVSDLLGRLETGDVIKAKVLETKPGEVVLRLPDGSQLKAAAGEDLDVKAGQTVSLAVTSKSEGTLYLETVKDPSRTASSHSELARNLLNHIGVKPDAKSLALASEFLKSGVSPTVEQFEKASSLVKAFKGIDVEKAVFVVSKGIPMDKVNPELLSKLLDGDLKLGEQLKDLQAALENIAKKPTGTDSKSTSSNNPAQAFLKAAAAEIAQRASTAEHSSSGALTSNTDSKGAATMSSGNTPEFAGNGTVKAGNSTVPFDTTAKTSANGLSDGAVQTGNPVQTTNPGSSEKKATSTTLQNPAGNTSLSATEQSNSLRSNSSQTNTPLNIKNDSGASNQSIQDGLLRNPFTKDITQANTAFPMAKQLIEQEQINVSRNTERAVMDHSGRSNTMLQSAETASVNGFPGIDSKRVIDSASNTIPLSESSGTDLPDPFSKLKDTIKEVFVNLDSDKSAEGLDLSKVHKELNDKLDSLKSALQSAVLSGKPGAEGITAAAGLIDDSTKMLNQFNSNNILYYQLPVNLNGQNTTAELYVMKRNQGKKKIDPHNSVLFVSLDTNNLGRFETLIDVKDSSVTLNIRTEKQEINEYIKENIKYLYSGLSESGYKLADIRYALIDSATPPVKLEQVLSKMIESTKTRVDMKI